MKTILVFCFALLGVTRLCAQRIEKDSIVQPLPIVNISQLNDSNKVYLMNDGDGLEAPFDLTKYLTDNIVYPKDAIKDSIEGTVYVGFIIEKDGSVDSVRLLKGVKGGRSLDTEPLRVVSAMPKWTPGKQNGHPVRIQYNLPIHFILNDSNANPNKK